MPHRGIVSLLFALLMLGGSAGVAAAAATPAPQISPPQQCFVEQNGALPLCTQNADGTWTVTYPKGGGNLDDGTSGGGSSSTKHDIGLAIVIVCVIGIIGIVIWQWVLPRRRNPQAKGTPPTVSGVPVTQATATAYYPDDHTAAATPVARPAAPPPEAFAPPAPASGQPGAAPPPEPPQQMVTETQAAQLTTLNNMLSQGQITREEYDGRRQAILAGPQG